MGQHKVIISSQSHLRRQIYTLSSSSPHASQPIHLPIPICLVRLAPTVGAQRRCLMQMGMAKESFVELTERIGRKTGGLAAHDIVCAAGHPDSAGALGAGASRRWARPRRALWS